MADANTYNIELRDKDGNLKQYLTPFASGVKWEWNRIGGCGRCQIIVNKAYRSIDFSGHDDIRIRVKSGSTSKLVYRGWINGIVPVLKDSQQITLDVRGYFDLLKFRVVHDSGDTKTYTSQELSTIVTDIIDTFITPTSDITKGTIDIGLFTADTLEFLTTVESALKTIAELTGDIEYGVDEDLAFFWRTESTSLRQRFFVGNNVELFERRWDWSKLVNKIYFQGGDISEVPYLRTAENTSSQDSYFLSEKIVSNSSIITDIVADQLLGSILQKNSKPILKMRVRIPNTDLRLEDTLPIGKVSIFDADYDHNLYIWGTAANGGSDLTWGSIVNSGSGAIWGGAYKAQIDKIAYTLSDEDEKFNLDITFGDTMLETAAKIKRLESIVDSLRQK